MELNPLFDKNVSDYSATTKNATNRITAQTTSKNAEISVFVNGVEIENGTYAEWHDGANIVEIIVHTEDEQKSYRVAITKE